MDSTPCFSAIFTKGDNFCDTVLASLNEEAVGVFRGGSEDIFICTSLYIFTMGSSPKRKNLLLQEQILPFKSGPIF